MLCGHCLNLDPRSHRHQDTLGNTSEPGEGHDPTEQSLLLWRNVEGCDSLPQRESLWEKCPVRDGKFLSCNLSHWKPQARFPGPWDVMSAGSGLLPVAERQEWREEEEPLFPSPLVHTSSVHKVHLPLSGGSMMSWKNRSRPQGSTVAALTSAGCTFLTGNVGGRGP